MEEKGTSDKKRNIKKMMIVISGVKGVRLSNNQILFTSSEEWSRMKRELNENFSWLKRCDESEWL